MSPNEPCVENDGQEVQESGQQIFSSRDPDDCFRVQRMHCKDAACQQCNATIDAEWHECQRKQNGVSRVQNHVEKMVAPRRQTGDFVIDLPREKCERDIQLRVICREDHPQMFPRDSMNREILDDEKPVVDGRKVLEERRSKRKEGEREQSEV